MKSARIDEYGDSSVIKIVDIENPTPNEGQVLVEVHASSINPFDTAIRSGAMKEFIPLELPITPGGDIAGVVTEIGQGVDGFARGDKVYGQANVVAGSSGAFAEYAVTKAGHIAKMPSNLDFQKAASLPLVGVSAWQALVKHIDLKSQQKIFIHGGAGGIGTVAIQIAKNIGAHVATTATGKGLEYVKGLGVDEVIDYKSQDFAEILEDFDAVFDTVGGDDFAKSFGVLKSGSTAVTMIAQFDPAKADELGITALMQQTNVTTEALSELAKLVELGVVTPHVDKVYDLDDIAEAFRARESGEIIGKVVISIKE